MCWVDGENLTQQIQRHVISRSKSRGPYAESNLISGGRRCQHVHLHSEAIVYRTIEIGLQLAALLLALHPRVIKVVAPRPNQSQLNMGPLSSFLIRLPPRKQPS